MMAVLEEMKVNGKPIGLERLETTNIKIDFLTHTD